MLNLCGRSQHSEILFEFEASAKGSWSTKKKIGVALAAIAALGVIALIIVAVLSQKGVISGPSEYFMNHQFLPALQSTAQKFSTAFRTGAPAWPIGTVAGIIGGIAVAGGSGYYIRKRCKRSEGELANEEQTSEPADFSRVDDSTEEEETHSNPPMSYSNTGAYPETSEAAKDSSLALYATFARSRQV